MRTIRENLEEAIGLLKTNLVLNHIKACELVFMDLSTIKDFPKEPISVLVYYQKYLVEKHQSAIKVGLIRKIIEWFHSRNTARILNNLLNICQTKDYRDEGLLQQIFLEIRKAI